MTHNTDHVPPIFLVGAERSGSTLLRLMLDHHPQVTWLNEFEYSIDLVGDNGSFPEAATYRRWLATHRVFQASKLAVDADLPYRDLVQSFLVQCQTRTRKPYVGATVHRHFDRLLYIWPDARFIHIVRDPRDVARSCIGMGWAGNVYRGVERWIEVEALWERFHTSLSEDRWMDVRFEDLVSDPNAILGGLCRFIGVPFDEGMLEIERDTTYERPNAALATQWQTRSRNRDIQLVESRTVSLLEKRGYSLSGIAPTSPDALERLLLLIHDRVVRLGFRLRRLGWRLWMEDVLSRRIGSDRWRESVQLKLNQVTAAHLR